MTEDFSEVARERGGGGGEVDVERRTLSRESSESSGRRQPSDQPCPLFSASSYISTNNNIIYYSLVKCLHTDSSEILSDPETESDFTPPSPLPSLSSSPISLTASQQQRVEQCTRIGLVATHKCPSSILTEEDQREMAAIRASLGMLPRKSEAIQDRRWDDRREERESSSRAQRSCSPRGPETTWEVESNAVLQYCGISEHSRDLCRGSTAESAGRQEGRQWRGESSQCTSAPHCGSEGGWRGGDCTVGSTVNTTCEDKTYSLRDSQSLSANGRFDESDNSRGRGLQEWSPLDNHELVIKLLNLKEQRQYDRQLARSAPSTRASSRDELRASDCGPPAREGEEQATGTGLTQPGLLPQLNSSMPVYAERLTQRLRLGGTVGRGAQGRGRELHMPLESTYSQVGYQHSTEAGRPRGILGTESGAQSSPDGVGWPTGESRCRVSCEECGKHFNRQRDRKYHFQENLKTSHLYCSLHPLVLQPASLRVSIASYTNHLIPVHSHPTPVDYRVLWLLV